MTAKDWKIIIFLILLVIFSVGVSSSSEKQIKSGSTSAHQINGSEKPIKNARIQESNKKGFSNSRITTSSDMTSEESPITDWPPTITTPVSTEDGKKIYGSWKLVPGSENWYYSTEPNWSWCGGGSSKCQLTWWISNKVCNNPIAITTYMDEDGKAVNSAGWHGNYTNPYIAILGIYVVPRWNQIVDDTIPESNIVSPISVSCF